MKRSPPLFILSFALLVAGCSTQFSAKPAVSAGLPSMNSTDIPRARGTPGDQITIQDADGPLLMQKVAFRHGVSSVSVERLARRFGCTGGTGAGLLTEKGPVEVYRMQCDDGAIFLARCELRQCRPMR